MREFSIPRLSWLNGKTHPQGSGGRKGISGHLPEHIEAKVINDMYNLHAEAEVEAASRSLAKQIDLAMAQ